MVADDDLDDEDVTGEDLELEDLDDDAALLLDDDAAQLLGDGPDAGPDADVLSIDEDAAAEL